MKLMRWTALVVLLGAGCATTPSTTSKSSLVDPLRPYVQQVAASLGEVPAERKVMLDQIAATACDLLAKGQDANMTVICTHNSRRSQRREP